MNNFLYIICETEYVHDGYVNNLKQLIKKSINKKINRNIEEDQPIDISFLKNA